MNYLQVIRGKIYPPTETIALETDYWHTENKRIVFTNGCFDLIHRGHIEYLAQAASLGDIFVIGLNSDASVKRLKGNKRPIISQSERALALAALQFVSKVVVFDEDTPLNLIKKIAPTILIKGGDYDLDQIVGADFVLSHGGEVKTIPFVNGYSTTDIIKKIKNL